LIFLLHASEKNFEMMTLLSRFISVILHPLIIPLAGILLILASGGYLHSLPWAAVKIILIIVFVTSFAFPMSIVPFLYYRKITGNSSSPDDYQKLWPLLVTLIFYFLGYYILNRIGAPQITGKFMLGCVILAFILLFISTRWNISMHMAGIGCLAGTIINIPGSSGFNLQIFLISTILAAGLLGFSRLFLNLNKPAEVYTGFAAGFAVFALIM